MRHKTARLSLAMFGLLAACAVPTEAPKFTTQWNVPAKSTTISVNTFLPAGVSATTDNAAFQATVSPATTSIARTLGQDCSSCALANGQTIPKPAFSGGGSANVTVPSGVTGATLVRDTLTVTIANGFNFDPIRPSATARGYLVIRVANGTLTVGRDSIDGSALPIPANGTVTRKIPLTGTIVGASGLQVSTTINSPLGDPVAINTAQTFTVTGATGPLFISSASVSLANQSVTSTATDFDLSDVDSTITDHLETGSLQFTLTNPFTVTGTLNVTLTGGTAPITKQILLATGTTATRIDFTKPEIQSLFGHKITITYSGTVNGSNVTVSPGQTVSVVARLQIGINTGGK